MRVAVKTLGCKVNQYDTAVVEGLLAERSWRRVDFSEAADAYLINSCTVTDRADAEARRLARRARRTNPEARVIMTGCYAQTSPGELAALDEIDYVVGLGHLPELLSAIAGDLAEETVVSDLRRATEVSTFGISSFPGRSRAYVKVQEGCDLFCTFCIVPVARGRSRSVEPAAVLEEIERLQTRGHKEVVLTGVHLGGYGLDLSPAIDLARLLEAVADARPALRVRLSSIDPPELGERVIDILAGSSVFCPHLHVPLQAGDDDVLRRMKRNYTTVEAASALDRIRRRIPDVCIGTDLITGFPGETEEEFRRSLDYIESLQPSYLHVFPYSERSSTSAAKRWPALPDSLVHERAREMRLLDRRLRERYRQRFIGRRVSVLIEQVREPQSGLLKGYSENYLPVSVEGEDRWMNEVVAVDLFGRAGDRMQGRIA